MTIEISQVSQKTDHKKVALKVRYIAARQPFVDTHASMEETLAQLKPRVLSFFGLSEGAVDGGTKSYSFALDNVIQTNLEAKLGVLADSHPNLKLDLIERFEQG